jgi:predicted CXXCH cytochrome family protein
MGLHVTHTWVDAVDDAGSVVPGPMDASAGGVDRFRVYRLRFRVTNDADNAVIVDPTLQFGSGQTPILLADVPSSDEADRSPFYLAPDDGPTRHPRTSVIRSVDLRPAAVIDLGAPTPADGLAEFGLDAGPVLTIPANAFTDVVVAIRATAAAKWDATYAFRLALDPAPLTSVDVHLTLGPKPAIVLTPGQRAGVVVADPVPLYPLLQPEPRRAGPAALALAEAAPGATQPITYRLAALAAAQPSAIDSPHVIDGLASDTCAACHAAHTAQGPRLLQEATPESNLCFRCHDGTQASDVLGQYTDPTVPANDPASASWYSHPATTASDHTTDRENEFEGRLDRHASCADCHQPHLADATAPIQTSDGWTASGLIRGASGVSVVNGAAGTSPTYTWNPATTLEYELCFKCHSGFTELPPQDPAHPSWWSLDKGVELNPANASYHPIEAAGTNATPAMSNSLSGTSPYKLWTFQTDSTVRCVDCHGDSRLADPASPPDAGAPLAPHAVPNQSLLMAPYRDRLLKPAAQPYDAADFALCYQCHGESPMVDFSGDPNDATNFRYHGYHLNAIDAEGLGGTDIDVDGAGAGNALCAECHFRIHGSSDPVDGQADNTRLVNFAPNVQPYRGVLSWTGTSTGGSCTLICHGITHSNWSY